MNPILAMLSHSPQVQQANQAIDSMKNKNPNDMLNELMQTNPQFKQFVEENKNMSPEDIARKYGVNPAVLSLLKR